MPRYRADIDGLRAVAIVPVILFHARVEGFGGGFVGVDVFFVISGYLISSLILSEVREGRFSIVSFYERRVRRIIPALFAVVIFSLIASYFLFLPINFSDFGKSVIATAMFISNIYFWNEAGYFAGSSELKPLLHTWSLSIEEQFYIFFPLFIIIVGKFQKSPFVKFTVPLLLISFLISVWSVANNPDPAFYLTPSRAWELLIGCLLAMGIPIVTGVSQMLRHLFSIVGLGMIAWSIWSFSSATNFPGTNALFPCLGAAFIIWAGESGNTIVGRILALRPLVFIGLISYSLYLWHWPLFVFARYYAIRDLTGVEIIGVIAASVLISIASWRFVEKPFRGKTGLFSRGILFRVTGVTVASVSAVALVIYLGEGFPQRLDPTAVRLAAAAQDTFPERKRCSKRSPDDVRKKNLCRIGIGEGPPSFIVWGDSHAEVLLPAVSAAATLSGRAGLYATRAGCIPLLDVRQIRAYFGEICREFGFEVIELIERSTTIEDIILISRWASFVVGQPYGNEKGLATFIQDSESTNISIKENEAVFERGLKRTFNALDDLKKKTIFVAQVPEIGWNVPSVLARSIMFDSYFKIEPSIEEYYDRQINVLKILNNFRSGSRFDILYPHEFLCSSGYCDVLAGDTPLYFDDDHLTVFGTHRLIGMFQSAFD